MNMLKSSEKIARVLRADKDTVRLSARADVLEKIAEENGRLMKKKLDILGVKKRLASDIYSALLKRIEMDDKNLSKALGNPVCDTKAGCRPLFDAAEKSANIPSGFFLKEEKAREMLINEPPKNMLRILDYGSSEEMLEKEDLFEVFSALRFVEDGAWMNDVFFKQYEKLSPKDFEERKIKVVVLSKRWKKAAKEFLKKKYHNTSHLKELGVIFVLPAVLGVVGETLRTLGLVLHYFHEIDFYCRILRRYAQEGNFAEKLVSSLRGDVLDERIALCQWMIVQRYLAKDDENDWRLFEPHVNPEAIHWEKATNDIANLGFHLDSVDLSFWKDINWVGDYYPTRAGIDVLVSFNLVDAAMSLIKKKELIKYLYHHQEALWNRIFSETIGGDDKMEELVIKNWEHGYIKNNN